MLLHVRLRAVEYLIARRALELVVTSLVADNADMVDVYHQQGTSDRPREPLLWVATWYVGCDECEWRHACRLDGRTAGQHGHPRPIFCLPAPCQKHTAICALDRGKECASCDADTVVSTF